MCDSLTQVCAPIEGTTKEPAGSAFHQMAKIQVGELSWSPIDDDEDDMDDADRYRSRFPLVAPPVCPFLQQGNSLQQGDITPPYSTQ